MYFVLYVIIFKQLLLMVFVNVHSKKKGKNKIIKNILVFVNLCEHRAIERAKLGRRRSAKCIIRSD